MSQAGGEDGTGAGQEMDESHAAVEPDAIGLPCDVKQFLTLHCQRCHGAEAKNGTPLLTRENLMASAKKDPSVHVADRILVRVSDTEKPMPPLGKGEPVSADDLEMFTAWVDDAMPAGRCDEEFMVPLPPAPMMPAAPTTPASP